MLFEIYQRFGSVTADARRLLRSLAPPILGAVGLILVIQLCSVAHAQTSAKP
jgi:hypothetical protein